MTSENEYGRNIQKEACMNKKNIFSLFMVLIFFNTLVAFAVASADAPRMTKEELRTKLGDNNIVVIDVRSRADWEGSESKIRGAVREDPQNVVSWAKKYPKEKTVVLYCS
jgi:predicted sulfurtransferase